MVLCRPSLRLFSETWPSAPHEKCGAVSVFFVAFGCYDRLKGGDTIVSIPHRISGSISAGEKVLYPGFDFTFIFCAACGSRVFHFPENQWKAGRAGKKAGRRNHEEKSLSTFGLAFSFFIGGRCGLKRRCFREKRQGRASCASRWFVNVGWNEINGLYNRADSYILYVNDVIFL